MKSVIRYVSFISLITLLHIQSAFADKNPEPIKIMTLDWTSQVVLSNIASEILSSIGYNVEQVPVGSAGQWYMLSSNKAHVQLEVWEGTMAGKFNKFVESGHIVDAGSHSAKTREEWWYPAYVEELCPGLPNWEALRNCHEIFATDKTAPSGRYVGGPWEKPDAARIRALDLQFQVIAAKTGDGIWEELKKAAEKKQPVVLFNWTPNWVEAVYDGKFVEFPEHDPRCETDSKWGVSKKYTWDCGNPKDGWLKKAVTSSFPESWPCAYQTIQNFSFSNIMIAKVAALVDVENMSHQDAAKKWVNENSELWNSWIPSSCTTS